MEKSNRLENIAAYNERSLKTLTRAIKLSRGKFSLIIARCNYGDLRGDILQLLRQQFEVEFQELVLPESATALYTIISDFLGYNPPTALMVFGLESAANLGVLLGSANRLRDNFRNFPFPVVLWVTDGVLKKLVSQASDFNTYASSPIDFSLPDRELIALVFQKVERAFYEVENWDFEVGEIEAFRKDLQSRESGLDGESKACLAFLMGWGYAKNKQIDAAVEKYGESWHFWHESNDWECRGIVELNMALACEKGGEKYWEKARNYLENSLDSFELANRQILVGRHISKLGRLLQRLEDWDSLKIVAEKALPLHIDYGEVGQFAEDCSFLARVAFQGLNWRAAKELILLALVIYDDNISDREKGWHRFILGRSQQELGEVEEAIDNFKEAADFLESARQQKSSEYDAKLHVEILNFLRDLLFERKDYLAAFKYKLDCRKIESQYRLRAFIGAGRLQPPPSAMDAAEKTVEEKTEIAREIVAASGRQPDVEKLMGKMKSIQHKLTVIYGQSGVGKSSILQAGLIPALQLNYFEGRRYVPVLVQVYQNWLDSLGKELVKALNKEKVTNIISSFSAETILEEFRKNEERHLLTVLIFDQFEEFFFERQDSTSRGDFYKFLRDCLEIPYLKVILSLREDYFYCLFEFTRLFHNLKIDKDYDEIIYYLGNFSRPGAKAVIASLTKGTPTQLDGDLVEELVEDLAKEFDYVRPIELQVVGTQLEREKIGSLEEYGKKGPKNALVGRFLEDSVKDCGLEYEEKAKLILYLLTDEKETRPLKTRDDFELELAVDSETLDLILEVLVKSGLVLRVPALPNDRYQLVHDYLVPFVRQLQSAPIIAQLEKEREQRKLTEAKLNKALKKQLRTARQAAITLVGLLVVITGIAAGSILFAINSYMSNLTTSSEENRQLDRLVSAIDVGKWFKRLSWGILPENKLRVAAELNQAVYELAQLSRLEGHESNIVSISSSSDGKMVASVSEDGIVKVWRIDGSLIATWDERTEKIFSISFSPDNKTIALVEEKTVKLYNLEGTLIKTFSGHQGNITSIRFSDDGNMLASASEDKTIKLWNIDGILISTLSGHKGKIVNFSISKDGKIVSADNHDRVMLWSRNGKQIKQFDNYGTLDLKFNENKNTIILINRNYILKEYNFQGRLLKILHIENQVRESELIKAKFLNNNLCIIYHEEWSYLAGQIIMYSRKVSQIIEYTSSDEVSLAKNILAYYFKNKIFLENINSKNIDYGIRYQTEVLFTKEENLITLDEDKTVKLWDGYGNVIKSEKYDSQPLFSHDRKTIMTTYADTSVEIWSLDSNQPMYLQGYSGTLREIRFSPNGKTIAAINGDNTIKLWRSDGTLIRTFTGSANKITSLKFSPDSQLMAAIGNNKVDIWNSNSDRVTTLSKHNDIIEEILFSPDSQRIATIDSGNVAKLWNGDGKQVATLEKHFDGINKILFSPDSQLIASIGEDNFVNLWTRNGEPIKTLIGHREGIHSISFSPDSQILAFIGGSNNSTIELWKRDGTWLSSIETVGVANINFSPDSNTIASMHANNIVQLWKVNGTLVTTFRQHNDRITSVSFSPDSKFVASASNDRTIRLWNAKGEQIQVFPGYDRGIDRVTFSDEETIVSISNFDFQDITSTLKLWTLNGTELQTIEGNSEESNAVNFTNDSELVKSVIFEKRWFRQSKEISQVKLSSDRKLINSVRQDDESNYTVEFWNTKGDRLKSIPAQETSRFTFSPDGRMVSIATEQNHSLTLWNMDGESLATIEDSNHRINGASISPDGKIIASASNDNTVKLLRPNGTILETLSGHEDKVNTVSFSPDGKIIASGSDDKTVKLWTTEGELLGTLEHNGAVKRLMFSHNGKYIAAASHNEAIKLWTKDGTEIEIVDDDNKDLFSFSPDNKMLAIASSWENRVSLYLLNGMWFKQADLVTNGPVLDISFSPDSQSIAVLHEDDVSILKWDIDELLQEACRLGRNHLKHNPNMKDKRRLCDGVDVGE